MPTYLVHGFRWHRTSIRIHVILHDLDDAAPEWIIAPATSLSLLNSLNSLHDFLPPSHPPWAADQLPAAKEKDVKLNEHVGTKGLSKKNKSSPSLRSHGRKGKPTKLEGLALAPDPSINDSVAESRSALEVENKKTKSSAGTGKRPTTFNDWSVVKFLEQFDPINLQVSQPWAYVADYMVEVGLGVSVAEETAKYEEKRKETQPLDVGGSAGTSTTLDSQGIDATAENSSGNSASGMERTDKTLGWLEKLRDALQKGEDIGWHVVVCGDELRTPPPLIEREMDRLSFGSEDDPPLRTPRSAGLRGFFNRKKNLPED